MGNFPWNLKKKITCKYYRTFISMVFNFARTQFRNIFFVIVDFFMALIFRNPNFNFDDFYWLKLQSKRMSSLDQTTNLSMNPVFTLFSPTLCNFLLFFLFFTCWKLIDMVKEIVENSLQRFVVLSVVCTAFINQVVVCGFIFRFTFTR